MGVPVTITVVDDGGNLKAMRRMDGAPLVSVQTAQNKAYAAAAAIGMPVDEFFEAIKNDAAAVASFASRPGLALIAGGIPLRTADEVIGGLGVAGAMTAADDRKIAEAGARQATSEPSATNHP
jgi:glc operon protein GlcG